MANITKEEILEGNNLIAEFMNLEGAFEINTALAWRDKLNNLHQVQYHSKWAWIMPVVQKIEKKGFIVQITFCLAGSCQIFNHKGNRFFYEHNNPIEAIWFAALEFIKWHNTKNKN